VGKNPVEIAGHIHDLEADMIKNFKDNQSTGKIRKPLGN